MSQQLTVPQANELIDNIAKTPIYLELLEQITPSLAALLAANHTVIKIIQAAYLLGAESGFAALSEESDDAPDTLLHFLTTDPTQTNEEIPNENH